MKKMLRDAKGRYSGRELDPRIQKMIESERETVKNIEAISRVLKLTPEDLGLRKGPDGEYQFTYKSYLIICGGAKAIATA